MNKYRTSLVFSWSALLLTNVLITDAHCSIEPYKASGVNSMDEGKINVQQEPKKRRPAPNRPQKIQKYSAWEGLTESEESSIKKQGSNALKFKNAEPFTDEQKEILSQGGSVKYKVAPLTESQKADIDKFDQADENFQKYVRKRTPYVSKVKPSDIVNQLVKPETKEDLKKEAAVKQELMERMAAFNKLSPDQQHEKLKRNREAFKNKPEPKVSSEVEKIINNQPADIRQEDQFSDFGNPNELYLDSKSPSGLNVAAVIQAFKEGKYKTNTFLSAIKNYAYEKTRTDSPEAVKDIKDIKDIKEKIIDIKKRMTNPRYDRQVLSRYSDYLDSDVKKSRKDASGREEFKRLHEEYSLNTDEVANRLNNPAYAQQALKREYAEYQRRLMGKNLDTSGRFSDVLRKNGLTDGQISNFPSYDQLMGKQSISKKSTLFSRFSLKKKTAVEKHQPVRKKRGLFSKFRRKAKA